MKAIQLKRLTEKILAGIFAIILVVTFGSCARSFSFMTSSVVPAARGNVQVSKDKNKNWVIKVEIYNLAEVERLQNTKQTYVVWLVSDQEITKNIGKLKSSSSLFSKQLKATLKTVSSSKPIKFFISAEDNPDIQYPGSQIVLSTDRF